MDHSKHVRLQPAELTADTVDGATIYGPSDETISSVDHLHGSGEQAQVVFDVGGFLGIGSKRVSLFASQIDFMRDEDGDVHGITQMTTDQLKALPEHID